MMEEKKIEDIKIKKPEDELPDSKGSQTEVKMKISLSAIFKKIGFLRGNEEIKNPALMYPRRDWVVILFTSVFFVILIIIFVTFLMLSINSDEIYVVGSNNIDSSSRIDESSLSKAISLFDKKNKEFQSILINPLTVKDPAL